MNNMFIEDMKNHYLPNLQYIENIDLDKYLETFHKIDKKICNDEEKKIEVLDSGENVKIDNDSIKNK